MPAIPRQLGSLIPGAIQLGFSTVPVVLFGPPTSAAVSTVQTPVSPSIPAVSTIAPVVPETSVPDTLAQPTASSTSVFVSQTPTVSVIVITTTTSSTPLIPITTQAVTSSSETLSSSSVISLALTPPVVPTPEASAVPTSQAPSVSATGVAANSGKNAQNTNSNMSSGIIALIAVGAVLAALLAGAFIFRRIQIYRRAKRRENNYGAGAVPDNAPFPFTNVSEADLRGAQPVRDFDNTAPQVAEKPLPSVAPDLRPVVGAAAGYGYEQNARTASPAPSQAPRVVSLAPAVAPASYPNPFPQVPTPAPNVPAPVARSVPQATGMKRVIQTFQPTLPDELDIHEGDWVTILHAYDDGWGLCECNGRRGVIPLECLDPGRPDPHGSRRFSSLSAVRQ